MSEQTSQSASGALSLPDNPSLEWLRKTAKRRLEELQQMDPNAQLADAQFEVAKQYGFASWRALKAHIDLLSLDAQLFDAAKRGDVAALSELLDRHPEKLHVRSQPYEHTLLHTAAQNGQLAVVDLLLQRGLDVNVREKGDNTYPMHWAAAGGHLDVVRHLIDAGGDVIGAGDDHELEVIGWATCWDGADDAAHRAVADLLVRRGARHHIFSAISLNMADEVRRIVAQDPATLNRRMSRNEANQLPLHFAVGRNRPDMVRLLLELGADPLATDSMGQTPAMYATTPGVDRSIMEKIRAITAAELLSAERGSRPPRATAMDVIALLAIGEWENAERVLRDNPQLLKPEAGVLHTMVRRNDSVAVKWLLDHGASPNGHWHFIDTEATPLHIAARDGNAEMVRLLLAGGADPLIKDSKWDGDAIGWANHFHQWNVVQLLAAYLTNSS